MRCCVLLSLPCCCHRTNWPFPRAFASPASTFYQRQMAQCPASWCRLVAERPRTTSPEGARVLWIVATKQDLDWFPFGFLVRRIFSPFHAWGLQHVRQWCPEGPRKQDHFSRENCFFEGGIPFVDSSCCSGRRWIRHPCRSCRFLASSVFQVTTTMSNKYPHTLLLLWLFRYSFTLSLTVLTTNVCKQWLQPLVGCTA